MYYDNYNLRQLLEFALRVPEVGAVNFNILYYVLKTIIQKQGLEGVKPVITLDTPLDEQDNAAETKLKEVPLRRSYSAESLQSINISKASKISEEDFSERKTTADKNKETNKWDKIKFFQRVEAVEEEISEIHALMAQFVDKVTNLEGVFKLQETKLMKEIADLKKYSIKSKKEEQDFGQRLEQLFSDVSKLKLKEYMKNENGESIDEEKNDLGEFKKESEEKIKEDSLDMKKEQEESQLSWKRISEKMESVFAELDLIKKHLKMEPYYVEHKDSEDVKVRRKGEIKDGTTQVDITQSGIELLNVSVELHKLMERCSGTDKRLSSELSLLNEKIYVLEKTATKCEEEIEAVKTNWDETIVSFDNMREDLQSIEKEMSVLTEFPGLKNRVEQMEEYVYSGYEYQPEEGEERKRTVAPARPRAIIPDDKLISKAGKVTKQLGVTDKKHVEIFKPTFKKTEKQRAQDFEDFFDEDAGVSEIDIPVHRKFMAYSRNVVLIQDMEKRKHAQFIAKDFNEAFDEEEDYMYEEPVYETAKKSTDEDFGEISEAITPKEMAAEYSSADIKSSTFTSSDILEEHSRQLKGQVIVFVKKRLHMFEIDLQHIEGSLVTMMKKVEFLEKNMKELGEKLTFLDANFNQRAGDFTALKEMTENHHLSIVTIMHHLDRKAEAYAVNQKVSRKELTVIEDRMLKLCVTSSEEMTKLNWIKSFLLRNLKFV